MKCCQQCQGIENLFDQSVAADDLKDYRKNGPATETTILLEALKAENVKGKTLLDIGGGVGAIQHELFTAGISSAIHVDASSAYLEASRREAERRGHADCVRHHYGDFVDLAPDIPPADIVTLDRVICCYHDMPSLVRLSSARAGQLFGLVFPRDTWWLKFGVKVVNTFQWLRRDPMRFFAHSTRQIDAIARQNGLTRRFYRRTFFWQVMVYVRTQRLAFIALDGFSSQQK